MEIIFVLLLIIVIILAVSDHSSGEEKIKAYIKERGGTFVSKEREYFDLVSIFSKYVRAYKLVYYDRNNVLRSVLLRVSYGNIDFIDDHAVHPNNKKYHSTKDDIEPVGKEDHKTKLLVDYTYKSNKGRLIIRQEFYQPNKGEFVFIGEEVAPDGKYKIGFMNYIIVEDGMVKDLTMV